MTNERAGRSWSLGLLSHCSHCSSRAPFARWTPTRSIAADSHGYGKFPTAWARYGQRFDYQAARGSNLLGIGQTEQFLMNLAGELREAATSGVRDIAFDAAYMPARIARRAFDLDAIELSRRALGLSPVVYTAVGRGPATEIAEIVREKAWRHRYEFARYPLASYVE